MNYFVGVLDKSVGPLSEEQVRNMIIEGRLRPQDLFWVEGMSEWQPLYRCSAFFVQKNSVPMSSHSGGPVVSMELPVEKSGGEVKWIGYAVSLIGFFTFALVLGPIGLIIGIVLCSKKSMGHGLVIVFISVVDIIGGLASG